MKQLIFSLIMAGFVAFSHGQPTGWTVNSSQYEYSMTITGTINNGGQQFTEGGDFVAAFSGEECRGVTETVFETDMDKVYFYLTVFSNTFQDEEITLQFYDAANETTSEGLNTVTFADGKNTGTVSTPFIMYLGNFSIDLSSSTVVEGNTSGIFLATLNVPELSNEEIQYGLVSDTLDNSMFSISGDSLFVDAVLDYEADSVHQVEIQVTLSDGVVYFYTLEVLVSNDVSDDDATSVQHQTNANIQVYPNPCSRVLTIEVAEEVFTEATMYDLTGKQVISIPLNNKTEKLDVTDYSRGMYVLVLSGKSGRKEVRQVIVE